jgi:NAD(P)-dependent dehydrogenase (short-subunit alcohol dehydrogenase family)
MMLDSNGSNTTAVAAVVKIEESLGDVKGRKALVTAGTGPVGLRVAGLLARDGARVWITSRKPEDGERARGLIQQRFGVEVQAMVMREPAQLEACLNEKEMLINCGPAGVQLVPTSAWTGRPKLKIAVDLNAVPPLGIEGIDVNDAGARREGVIVYGALGVGNLKTKLHKACITRMFERNDLVLDAETIADVARELVAAKS